MEQKSNVEQIIKKLFAENYKTYPESYPLTTGYVNNSMPNPEGELLATDEAVMNVQDVAKMYYENRAEQEIDRDEKLGITEIDYVKWCMEEFGKQILNFNL
jgi:hypothetical protein